MINNPIFIKELENKLNNYQCDNHNCGIVIGDAGMILALSELYIYSRTKYYLDKMYEILNVVIEGDEYDLSLGYGVSGLAWCISLINEELIENKNEWLISVHQMLATEYSLLLEQENLDYYRGATGLLFYFLNSPTQNDKMTKIIDSYLKTVQTKLLKNDLFEADYKDSIYVSRVLNLGTPHGLTGIILTLLIIKEKGFDVDENLLICMFKIIISYEFKNAKKTDCHFPCKVYEDGRRTRSGLAWCYGDLMIAYAMLKYGIIYKNDYFTQYSKNILIDSLSKKIVHSEKLILCHGYPSLSLIYDAIYKKTGDYIYYDTSKQYEQKFKQVLSKDYIEYKKNNIPHYFFDKSSLLIGYPGAILLSLFWEGYDDCGWSNCLLL